MKFILFTFKVNFVLNRWKNGLQQKSLAHLLKTFDELDGATELREKLRQSFPSGLDQVDSSSTEVNQDFIWQSRLSYLNQQ